jgi:hypothetical protein
MIQSFVRRVSPEWLLRLWFKGREQMFLRANRGRSAVFSAIHAKNIWRNSESRSGFGSTMDATREIREGIARLVDQLGIASILDAPCGDYNWMRSLAFEGDYTGGDIVPDLVARNQQQYGDARHRFVELDLVKDTLPAADLVLCRECLNHLSLSEASAAVDHMVPAARKVLMLTHYPSERVNADQPASFRYRPLNFTLAPFRLREPDLLIDESRTEAGKSVACWFIERGPVRVPG